MTLREKLIVLRDKAGISQMALAHQLGVSRQAVSRWESGDATPSMDKLKALAKIYGVSLDWLCSDASDAGALVQEKNLDERDPVCNSELPTEDKPKKRKKWAIIGIETAVRFPMSVLMNKSAWAVFGVAWLYAWLLYGFFCLILIVSNLKFHTNVGYMLVVLCLIFKRFLEYVPEVSLLKYISPCDVASISARPITAVNVIYTVLFFLVADWILWRAARRQMEQVDL